MIKKIFIQDDVIKNVKKGKCIDGSIRIDAVTGQLTFRAFNHSKRAKKPDTLICETETGWLKESAQRVKFFSSVKKTIPTSNIRMAMSRDMYEGMEVFAKAHNGNGNVNGNNY